MKQETIHEMNAILDIANEIIEEDKDLLAKTKHIPTVTYTGNDEDLIDDYKYARDTLKNLISSGEFALAKMESMIQDTQTPGIFEVFSKLIKSIADLSTDLIKLQKSMKDIATPMKVGGTNTTKQKDSDNVEMTTGELNELLNKNKEK